VKALVSCIRQYGDDGTADYFLVMLEKGGIETRKVKSKVLMDAGEFVEVTIKDGLVENAISIEESGSRESFEKDIEKASAAIPKGKKYTLGIAKVDAITEKLWAKLEKSARILSRKLLKATPIMIRFHNDVDGVSGACALQAAITKSSESNRSIAYAHNITWRMHGGVSYNREDATADMMVCNNFESKDKPLLIILDFGTSEESNPGIELIRDKFDVVWLDHHPILEKFNGVTLENYVNPWGFGGDSNYTAGFLTCMFARAFADVDTKDVEQASFIGDYSEFMNPSPESRRISVLMDLLSSDTRLIAGSRGNLNPKEVMEIVADKKRSDELAAYAENRVSEMLDTAIKSVKEYKAKSANVYVADFEGIRGDEEARYPLPGRFASKLLDKIEELNKTPCVLLLHFGYFVSVRMSKKLTEKVDLLKKLEQVKAYYSNYVDSTGGHSNAASIKMKGAEMKKEVIKYAVDKLKEDLS
jgi:archaea-specific RecJ-like exonuclease